MGTTTKATGERAFGPNAAAGKTVRYASHQEALKYLLSAASNPNGIGLVQGPPGSGKTTVVRELAGNLSRDAAVALIDGTRLKPRRLLTAVLSEFEIETNSEADDELLKMVSEFAAVETRRFQAPIIIIDNIDKLYPSALRIVNLFAMLNEDRRHTIRILATGCGGLNTLVESDGMSNFSSRALGVCSMQPLTSKETMIYLHTRLQGVGGDAAETVFPFDVCDRLRDLSGGWPGRLNQLALESMQRAGRFPVGLDDTQPEELAPATSKNSIPVPDAGQSPRRDPPALIISKNGKLLTRYAFTGNKILIGRSDFADVIVNDDFVSKLHAVLILYTDALILLDLNSSNGITVNSVQVQKTILRTGDIISLGHHRLKVENAPAISREVEALLRSPDTIRMKNLRDLRHKAAKDRLSAVPDNNR